MLGTTLGVLVAVSTAGGRSAGSRVAVEVGVSVEVSMGLITSASVALATCRTRSVTALVTDAVAVALDV